jgi:hypothetical protein
VQELEEEYYYEDYGEENGSGDKGAAGNMANI